MARLGRRTKLVMAILLVGIAHSTFARNEKPKKLTQASVGRFKITLDDDQLPLEEMEKNRTSLRPHLAWLWLSAWDYWGNFTDETTPTEEEQVQSLTAFAKSELSPEEFNDFGGKILNHSKENASVTPLFDGQPHHDVVFSFMETVWNMSIATDYFINGAFIGVGARSDCAEAVDEVLSNASEWNKMGSSAATTMMALLPTFLAFGNLFVPRSSEAYTTSALVGLTTAFFTFGLPVKSMSAVKQNNVHMLAVFGIGTLCLIAGLGEVKNKSGRTKRRAKLSDLQNWSEHDNDEEKAKFVSIKTLVNEWDKRWHLWHAPALIVAVLQMLVFGLAIYPLFQYLGVPKFIFGCHHQEGQNWTGLYIGLSAGVNTILRYIMWESSNHERVKVYALSRLAKAELNSIISTTPTGETTATHIPPLHPPYLMALHNRTARLFGRKPPHHITPPQETKLGIIPSTIALVRRRVAFIFKGRNFMDVIKAGFVGATKSARRWRPVYILIHLSTEGRNPLMTLFTGFIEAGLLLVLTFFFASQWGGNLVLTMVALVLLLVFVTLGRVMGLVYVWLSSQVWGLSVVNCDTVDEIRGVLRILASMQDVLVVVNGATYFSGYRMDGRVGWNKFIDDYERGNFDHLDPEDLKKRSDDSDDEDEDEEDYDAGADAGGLARSTDEASLEKGGARTGAQVSAHEVHENRGWTVQAVNEQRTHEVV